MYAQDNPTNAVDPDGRWWKSVHRDHTYSVARTVMQGPPDNPNQPASLVAESDYGVDSFMKPEQDYIRNTGRHFNALNRPGFRVGSINWMQGIPGDFLSIAIKGFKGRQSLNPPFLNDLERA
ncbi:MAG: hypothetical protein M1548_06445, partial [Actinobacteria bacterium]|nr:hypothetical protein [Actinomycetota bacterium]